MTIVNSNSDVDRIPLIRASGITKTFPGTRALSDVSLSVGSGEIVAVVGQNGSGKSTFVKILAGIYEMDSGTLEVRGADGEMLSSKQAQDELHFIHQDLGLVSDLSAVENLALGHQAGARALAPRQGRLERRRARELVRGFGCDFDVTTPISKLSPPERTIVAIVRALEGWTRPDNVLVLDEPTAALHGDEVDMLFTAVRRVAENGAGVLFISHRLDEVLGLADRVVAFRDGEVVADERIAGVDEAALVQMIVGREVSEADLDLVPIGGEPILSVRGLSGGRLKSLDLDLRPGEVVGVTGLIGSGREHLAPLVFGSIPRSGEVRLNGEVLPGNRPAYSIRTGVAYVPADRRADGAVMEMSLRENLTLPMLSPLRRGFGRLSRKAELAEARHWIASTEIRPPDPARQLDKFSGGNQQKVVLAKCLRTKPRVLLLDEPTQGVDVGAKAAIYELIANAANAGCAVLVCSSDVKEVRLLSSRVLVLRDGELVAELSKGEASESRVFGASAGVQVG